MKPSDEGEEGGCLSGGAITVAFAGHARATDLGDRRAVAAQLRAAFDLLAAAGVSYATLLTGLAEGADRIAVEAWRARALGPVHAIHPYLDTPAGREAGLSHADTWLDGRAVEAEGRNAHLAQSQWLIGASDILVAVWTGAQARGAGGTADAVRLALEHKLPVLWIKPGAGQPLRLISPHELDDDFGALELVEQLRADRTPLVTTASAEALKDHLPATAFVEPPTSKGGRGWDRLLHRTLWRSYGLFVGALGAGAPRTATPNAVPPDLLEQTGFAHLTEAYQAADADAAQLADVHRSQQILLVVAAIGAAVIGSAPAVWPGLKIYAVVCELVLAGIALAISVGAARAERHARWGRARRVAEQLRLERAAWVLGLSTEGHRLMGAGPPPPEALRARRCAGVPEGAYDEDRTRRWGGWALAELVGGQARYHRDRGGLNARVAHRIHAFETTSFAIFLLALGGFIVAYAIARSLGVDLPHWLAGAVVMTSIIVPALGAASIALEAGLAFGEQSRRNRDMAERLEKLAASVSADAGVQQVRQAAKTAIRLQTLQEDRWSDESARRQLVRAG